MVDEGIQDQIIENETFCESLIEGSCTFPEDSNFTLSGDIIFTEATEIDNNLVPATQIDESGSSSSKDEDSPVPNPKFPLHFQPKCGEKGLPWEERRPPTELQALDALEEVQSLLHGEHCEGKQKRYKNSVDNAWGTKILQSLKVLF